MAVGLRRKRFAWATLGALVLCALLPGTGLWVRRAFTGTAHALVNPPIPNDGSQDAAYWTQRAQAFRSQTERDRAAALQMPRDFPLNLAACVNRVLDDYAGYKINDDGILRPLAEAENETYQQNWDERIAQKLRSLAPRFDSNPSYHASILRYLSFTSVRLNNRSDEAILYEALRANAIRSQTKGTLPAPESVALWHASAQTGERLEPQNAFFPFMDAVALFAEHRDKEAINALHRASTKTDFTDHALEEADGYARLQAAEGEPKTAFEKLSGITAVRLPHYAWLRACARLAVAKAVEAELQNRTDDGFHIRRDVRRIGTNLRQNAPTRVGSQVGSAIAYITGIRPGGAPVIEAAAASNTPCACGPPPDSAIAGDNKYAASEKQYETYLRRIGHANEAQVFAFEVAEQKSNQNLFEHADENPANYFYAPRLLWFVFAPQLAPFLLLNALFLLLLGGIAHMLARTRRIADEKPLPRAVRIGVGSAILIPLVGGLLIALVGKFWAWAGPELSLACALGCGVLVGLAFYLRARRAVCYAKGPVSRRTITDRIAGFLVNCRAAGAREMARTVGLWTLGLMCAYLVTAFFAYAAYGIVFVAQNSVVDLGLLGIDDYAYQTGECTVFETLAVCILCVPMLLLLFFAACSPKVGVPALAGMVRGMRGLAVPVDCCLVLLTVPLFVWLARADANLNRDINRAMQNENRYIAEISGKPWPLHKGPPAP